MGFEAVIAALASTSGEVAAGTIGSGLAAGAIGSEVVGSAALAGTEAAMLGGPAVATGSELTAAELTAASATPAVETSVANVAAGTGPTLSQIATGANAIKGVAGLAGASGLAKQAQNTSVDPFGSQRPQYAQMLQQLMQNPGTELSKTPGYQAGLDAVQRSMGAQGYTGSGNMMAALQQYGGNAFNQQAQLLSGLAGANFNNAPAQAGLQQQGTVNAINLAGQAVNTIGNAAATWGG